MPGAYTPGFSESRSRRYRADVTVDTLPVPEEELSNYYLLLEMLRQRRDVAVVIHLSDPRHPQEILMACGEEGFYVELTYDMSDWGWRHPLALANPALSYEEAAGLLRDILFLEKDDMDIPVVYEHFFNVTNDLYPEEEEEQTEQAADKDGSELTFFEFRRQFSSEADFLDAFGRKTQEEAKAMIDAATCPPDVKTFMWNRWHEARRKVFLSGYVRVRMADDGSLRVVFIEIESEFDGNDFYYEYALDADQAEAFLQMIPRLWDDPQTDVEEWLIENVHCHGFGSDLQDKWVRMGLHGTSTVQEDYPGGIYREETF